MATSNRTTHSIYRIVCFVTGKCYVGQSNDPKKRRRDHFYLLNSGSHENPLLQRAYNKYGKGAFYFEILESNIPSLEEVNEREISWIAHFDSFHNGYNLTLGGKNTGGANCRPCEWNGVQYVSVSVAARTLGISNTAMFDRVAKGYRCDNDIPSSDIPVNSTACEWNGVQYHSIKAAAMAIGITGAGMRHRLKCGYTCDEDLPRLPIKPVQWNGIKYSSMKEAARANGICNSGMSNRIRMGYTSDADILSRNSSLLRTSKAK